MDRSLEALVHVRPGSATLADLPSDALRTRFGSQSALVDATPSDVEAHPR